MTLPGGISKCTVTIGAGYTFLGEEAVISGSVIADRNVVWAATGAPIFKTESMVTPSISGGQASFAVPHVDQSGFLDNAGEAITGWYYVFNGRATFSDGRIEPITKRFQVFVGQTTVDLDLVPDGPVIPGVTTPSAAVLSVNGQTGTVVIESGGLDDDGIAALIPDGSTATGAALATSYAHLDEDDVLVIDGVPVGGSGGGGLTEAEVVALIAAAPRTPLPGPLEKTPTILYGHSYLAGVGTSGGRDISSRLTQRVGSDIQNRSTSGNTIYAAIRDMNGANSGGSKVWTPGTKGCVVLDTVINDARSSPDAAFTTAQLDGYRESLRSALRILRSSARVATGSGTIVKTGFAASFDGYNYSADASDVIVITPGAGITKIALGMGLTPDDPATRGFTYSVDGGATYTTVAAPPALLAPSPVHWLVPVTLVDGGTVRIKPLAGRAAFFMDYWIMQNPTPPSFVLVKDVPLGKTGMSTSGATLLTDPQYATSLANLAAVNAVVVSVAAEAEWTPADSVQVADPSPGFSYATDISSDLVHPNNIGAWKYANAIQTAANQLTLRDGMTIP